MAGGAVGGIGCRSAAKLAVCHGRVKSTAWPVELKVGLRDGGGTQPAKKNDEGLTKRIRPAKMEEKNSAGLNNGWRRAT